ncbi:MAG: hypothetical protein HCA25_03070 [Dolichospermum sp. DET50]|nr:hypothetical protein [Dolichospermum sp. DET66]MBS3031288.1 hypothetical protein [Dolichospermum sp. DET67]MBS3036498.1 hypothetical protein [Dolichospermum sp. DET50]QSX68547.1 MAG: hypothetical protein EZY12_02240 [Dolichospermum sp. DET69]
MYFNCIFTGKKVFSDAYSHKIEDDFVWIVEGKYEELSDQKFDDSLFGDNKSAEGEDVTEYKPIVNALLKAFRLEEPVTITSLNDFKKTLKKYATNLIAKLNEANPARVAVVKAKLPKYAKEWAENFDKNRVYVTEGDGFETEGTLIILKQNVPFGEEKPNDKCTITVLIDSLIKEKF